MKQLLIEIDDDVAARLEAVAPSRSRQRSEFIRAAIRRALWEREEQAIAAAYRQQPDGEAPYFDVAVWEGRPKRGARKRR
jgi:predicted transcriptional regulator